MDFLSALEFDGEVEELSFRNFRESEKDYFQGVERTLDAAYNQYVDNTLASLNLGDERKDLYKKSFTGNSVQADSWNSESDDEVDHIDSVNEATSQRRPEFAYALLLLAAPVSKHVVKLGSMTYRADVLSAEEMMEGLSMDSDVPNRPGRATEWQLQKFVDADGTMQFPEGTLKYKFKERKDELAKIRTLVLSDMTFTLTSEEDEKFRRKQFQSMLKEFPESLSDIGEYEENTCMVCRRADIQQAIKSFADLAKQSMKAYVIFNGHGGRDFVALAEERVKLKELVNDVLKLEDEIAQATLTPGNSKYPLSIEFVAAQCYSYNMPQPPEGALLDITALTKDEPHCKLSTNTFDPITKIQILDLCNGEEGPKIKNVKHVELEAWAEDRAKYERVQQLEDVSQKNRQATPISSRPRVSPSTTVTM